MQSYGELGSRVWGGVNRKIFSRAEFGEMGFLYEVRCAYPWRRFRYTEIKSNQGLYLPVQQYLLRPSGILADRA